MVDTARAFREEVRWRASEAAAVAPPVAAASPVASSAAKRAFDIFFAGSALLFLAPLLLLVAAVVWIESAGPVLFRQRRGGLNGKTFVIYKFRTMYVQEDGRELRHASRGDKRVTAFGSILRKSSIDELPQLLNVLKGDMSLVGPRPHALAHDRLYATLVPAYAERFRARPGLTGLAQVSGLRGEIHDLECMARRVDADNVYVEQWSFWLDLRIVLATIPLVLRDRAAY